MVLDELDLSPALTVDRTLRHSPLLCLGALFVVFSITDDSLSGHEAKLITGILLAACLGLALSVISVLWRSGFALVGRLEVLTLTSLLTLMVAIGAYGLRHSLLSHEGSRRPLLGLILLLAVVLIVYVFLYPRASDPQAQEPTVRDLLFQESRPGPQRAISSREWWLAALCSCLLIFPLGRRFLGPRDGLAVFAGLVALLITARCAVPALAACVGTSAFRTLRTLRSVRVYRRNRSYLRYLFSTREERSQIFKTVLLVVGLWSFGAACGSQRTRVGTLRADSGEAIIAIVIYTLGAFAIFRHLVRNLAASLDPAEAHRIEDTADFALYLRSFTDDEFTFDYAATGWRRFLLLLSFVEDSFRTFGLEELIVRTLWRFRPVIAIADSRAPTRSVGAVKVSVPDDEWRTHVLRKATRAKTVVAVLSGTAGLVWELRALVAEPSLRARCMIVLPPEAPHDLHDRWSACFGGDTALVSGLERVLVAKPRGEGHIAVLTANERTVSAYTMAIEIAEGMVRSDAAFSNPVTP